MASREYYKLFVDNYDVEGGLTEGSKKKYKQLFDECPIAALDVLSDHINDLVKLYNEFNFNFLEKYPPPEPEFQEDLHTSMMEGNALYRRLVDKGLDQNG